MTASVSETTKKNTVVAVNLSIMKSLFDGIFLSGIRGKFHGKKFFRFHVFIHSEIMFTIKEAQSKMIKKV